MSFREFFDLNAYLTSFVNFLKTMLGETHQPILISIYAILSKINFSSNWLRIYSIGRILDITGSKNKIALHSLLPELIPKLGDNRVTVRQECLLVCAQVCQVSFNPYNLNIHLYCIDDEARSSSCRPHEIS